MTALNPFITLVPRGWILAVLLVIALPGLCAVAQPVDQRIETILRRAQRESTLTRASELTDQAEQLRRSATGALSQTESLRLEADVLLARGRIAARFAATPGHDAKELRNAAARDLHHAMRLYRQVRTDAEAAAKVIEDRAVKVGQDYTGNRQWRNLIGDATRTVYTIAWCQHALGGVVETPIERETHLRDAINGFKQFTDGGYRNHPIIVDAFLGQALCLFEQKDYFAIKSLLQGVTAQTAPHEAWQKFSLVKMQAFQAMPSHLEVETAARAYFDSLPADHALDPIDLSMLLIRAQSLASLASERQNPQAYRSFQPALDAVVARLIEHGEPWASRVAAAVGDSGAAAHSTVLLSIREDFESSRYQQAFDAAARLLADAASPPAPIVEKQLRWIAAASAWRLERWRDAFTSALAFLEDHPEDPRAAEVAGLALEAAQRGAEEIADEEFESLIELVTERYPGLPQLELLPWYRAARMIARGEFEKAYRSLEDLPPQSPAHRRAQFGMALAALREQERLDAEGASPDEASTLWLGRAHTALNGYLAAPREGEPADPAINAQVHRLALRVVQGWLSLDPPQPNRAGELLSASSTTESAPAEEQAWRIALEGEYRVLAADPAAAKSWLDRVQANADALTILADRLEGQLARPIATRTDEQSRAILERLSDLYTRLLQNHNLDATPQTAIRARLAHALFRLERYSLALAQHERLLEALPPDQTAAILREMALSYEGLRQWENAMERWRTLDRGLPEGTEPWFEAKYHLIACHDRLGDRAHAVRLLDYLRLRHPDIPFDRWQRAFAELAAQWKPRD